MTNQAIAMPHPQLSPADAALLWARVARREPIDGWVIAVRTTGIYCRSGCPAKMPRRENMDLMPGAAAAERAGFRACKRCRPDQADGLTPTERQALVTAYRLMEEDGTRTAASLARQVGMSAQRLDRLVRRATGVSLAALDETRRFALLRAGLQEEKSVTDAIYAAGFAGPRRVYERGHAMLGMTPNRFRRGGEGERIGFARQPTVLGVLGLCATDRGVCLLCIRPDAEQVAAEVRQTFDRAELVDDPEVTAMAEGLAAAIASRQALPDLPIDIQATAFEAQVWQALLAIPRGQTRSYGDIARTIGSPGASRAVGRACGANPVALLIPCHRAVGKDGSLTGFAWGLPAKARLLQDEGALLDLDHGPHRHSA